MSIGPIPFSEITNYLDEYRIFSYSDRVEYIKWIQFIDHQDLKLQNDKATADKSKKNKAKHPQKKSSL
jgi:hypothetical protein